MESTCFYLDDVCVTDQGGVIVAASNLTFRYWDGEIKYYKKLKKIKEKGDFNKSGCYGDNLAGKSHIIPTPCSISNLKFLENPQLIVTAQDSGAITFYHLPDDQDFSNSAPSDNNNKPVSMDEKCELKGEVEHDDVISSLSLSYHQSKMASASWDQTVKIWDLEELRPSLCHKVHSSPINNIEFKEKDQNILASVSMDGCLNLWDLRSIKPVVKSITLETVATCLSWSPRQPDLLLVGMETGNCVVMDTRQLTSSSSSSSSSCYFISSTPLHRRSVKKIIFNPSDNSLIASCSEDVEVVVSSFHGNHIPTNIYTDKRHKDFVQSVAWIPTETKAGFLGNQNKFSLISCSWDSTCKFHYIDNK